MKRNKHKLALFLLIFGVLSSQEDCNDGYTWIDVLPETATILSESILNQFNCSDLRISACGPVLGAHTGPNFLGVSFYQTSNFPDPCILLQ